MNSIDKLKFLHMCRTTLRNHRNMLMQEFSLETLGSQEARSALATFVLPVVAAIEAEIVNVNAEIASTVPSNADKAEYADRTISEATGD